MTVVEPPLVILDPISTILADLSVCLCAQLDMDGLPPTCFCGVMPGNEVALDYAGDCEDACGMAWVRLITSYPSVSLGNPVENPGNCSTGIGLEVEMGVIRCIDLGDGMEPPPKESLEASSYLQNADMMAMWRAVACCRQSKDWAIGQYTPMGPEGGVVGGTLSLSILLV